MAATNTNGIDTLNYSYTFDGIKTGQHTFSLYQVYNNLREVNLGLLEVSIEDETPIKFSLSQNYPNPFNPSTKIKFNIPTVETGHAPSLQTSLIVYDVLGREVKTLINQNMQPGNYEIEFNATGLSSGVYFYKLSAGEFVETKKMMLVR
ncbi:MAG: T9SS type A sorting domain-containing protein [Melioribacteraceae bacterium]|nr:T9SS type A sorting domain-containing protein [Melioribacteraceae bacterium]